MHRQVSDIGAVRRAPNIEGGRHQELWSRAQDAEKLAMNNTCKRGRGAERLAGVSYHIGWSYQQCIEHAGQHRFQVAGANGLFCKAVLALRLSSTPPDELVVPAKFCHVGLNKKAPENQRLSW